MSTLADEARKVGHPKPEEATWGEVNVLSVAALTEGRLPSRDEATRFLEHCERISDFNDLFRD